MITNEELLELLSSAAVLVNIVNEGHAGEPKQEQRLFDAIYRVEESLRTMGWIKDGIEVDDWSDIEGMKCECGHVWEDDDERAHYQVENVQLETVADDYEYVCPKCGRVVTFRCGAESGCSSQGRSEEEGYERSL